MKLFRRWYWTVSAFLQKYIIILLIGVALGSGIVLASGNLQNLISIKPTQKVGRVGTYTLAELPLDIQELVSRGLTKVNKDGSVSEDVAKTISISEDGRTYTLSIDPNVFWSDNTKLSSHDIAINIRDADIERPSDEVIIITLQDPFSPLLHVLSQPILKRVDTGTFNTQTNVIGVNNYVIKDLKTQNQVIKNLQIEAPDNIINYTFYSTEADAITAFKLGEIDRVEQLNQPHLEEWPNTNLETTTNDHRFISLFLNTTDPNLQDKSIRQMLAYATPKPSDNTRIISPISSSSWAYNPQVKPYDYSPQVATSMFEKISSANQGNMPTFTITTTPLFQDKAQEIITAWEEIGINAQIKVVSFPDTNDYQILLIGQQIPKEPDQYALWHSTQSTNITKYQNPKIDKLLEDGRKELNQENRIKIYQDFQRFLVEDSPVIFLSKIYTYTLSRS